MISHKYKFIYTKIGKAGSNSIQTAFLQCLRDGNYSHIGHHHLLDDISKKTKDYFKFSIVRNPWARCVSRYFYVQAKSGIRQINYKNSTFDEFIRSKAPPYNSDDERKFFLSSDWAKKSPNLVKLYDKKHPFENQLDWVSDFDGNLLVDFLGKLENLQEDIITICNKIGIPPIKIPHRNKSQHGHYTEYYTEETSKIVAEKYAKDIEYFGYKFGE